MPVPLNNAAGRLYTVLDEFRRKGDQNSHGLQVWGRVLLGSEKELEEPDGYPRLLRGLADVEELYCETMAL